MARLYLVGFTTDLKNLVFATRRGAKSGSYLVTVDGRLRRTLDEIDRLEIEKNSASKPARAAPERSSKLTPKEIQAMLRAGKSPEDVAEVAETDVAWIEKFTPPILAEMAGVVDAVLSSSISKPRLGRSSAPVRDAIEANLVEKRSGISPEVIEEGWRAVRKDGLWEVTLRYTTRGRLRKATFAYEPVTRQVRPMNALASEIAWRAPGAPRPRRSTRPRRKATQKRTRRTR